MSRREPNVMLVLKINRHVPKNHFINRWCNERNKVTVTVDLTSKSTFIKTVPYNILDLDVHHCFFFMFCALCSNGVVCKQIMIYLCPFKAGWHKQFLFTSYSRINNKQTIRWHFIMIENLFNKPNSWRPIGLIRMTTDHKMHKLCWRNKGCKSSSSNGFSQN